MNITKLMEEAFRKRIGDEAYEYFDGLVKWREKMDDRFEYQGNCIHCNAPMYYNDDTEKWRVFDNTYPDCLHELENQKED